MTDEREIATTSSTKLSETFSNPEISVKHDGKKILNYDKTTVKEAKSILEKYKKIKKLNYTIKLLKSKIKLLGFKAPYGLTKKIFLQQFLSACVNQILNDLPKKDPGRVPTTTITPLYCNLDKYSKEIYHPKWLCHLRENGWVSVPIEDFDPKKYAKNFHDWFHSLSSKYNENDPKTWGNVPINTRGKFKHYIGHLPWMWEIREKCLPIFREIWQEQDLISSFDGACFLTDRKNMKHWFHVDQSRIEGYGPISIQGAVNLVDSGPDDGGLVLYENSRDIFKEYMENHPLDGFGLTFSDLDDDLVKYSDRSRIKLRRIIKVCAPAGHIILWDSRMIHSNIPPSKTGGLRMCTYVSMCPRSGAMTTELKRRTDWYKKGRMTGHICYGPFLKDTGKEPRTFGDPHIHPEKVEVAVLNENQKRLVGFK